MTIKAFLYQFFFELGNFLLFFQTKPGFGTIPTMDRCVLLEGPLPTRVWWRCTVVDSGELCVLQHGPVMLLKVHAGSLDTNHCFVFFIYQSECAKLYAHRQKLVIKIKRV